MDNQGTNRIAALLEPEALPGSSETAGTPPPDPSEPGDGRSKALTLIYGAIEPRNSDAMDLFRELLELLLAEFQPASVADRIEVGFLARDYVDQLRVRGGSFSEVERPVQMSERAKEDLTAYRRALPRAEVIEPLLADLTAGRPPTLPCSPATASEWAAAIAGSLAASPEELEDALDAVVEDEENEAIRRAEAKARRRAAGGKPAAAVGLNEVGLPNSEEEVAAAVAAREDARALAGPSEFEVEDRAKLRRLCAACRPARKRLTETRIGSVLMGRAKLTPSERRAWTALLEDHLESLRWTLRRTKPAYDMYVRLERAGFGVLPSAGKGLLDARKLESAIQESIDTRRNRLRPRKRTAKRGKGARAR